MARVVPDILRGLILGLFGLLVQGRKWDNRFNVPESGNARGPGWLVVVFKTLRGNTLKKGAKGVFKISFATDSVQ